MGTAMRHAPLRPRARRQPEQNYSRVPGMSVSRGPAIHVHMWWWKTKKKKQKQRNPRTIKPRAVAPVVEGDDLRIRQRLEVVLYQ